MDNAQNLTLQLKSVDYGSWSATSVYWAAPGHFLRNCHNFQAKNRNCLWKLTVTQKQEGLQRWKGWDLVTKEQSSLIPLPSYWPLKAMCSFKLHKHVCICCSVMRMFAHLSMVGKLNMVSWRVLRTTERKGVAFLDPFRTCLHVADNRFLAPLHLAKAHRTKWPWIEPSESCLCVQRNVGFRSWLAGWSNRRIVKTNCDLHAIRVSHWLEFTLCSLGYSPTQIFHH